MNDDRYCICIFYSDEDECFVADIPDLRSCSAFGDTAEEALREALVARQLWLESARALRDAVPEPRFRTLGASGAWMRGPHDRP
jgi:predicted RNase H-like HicB family nuclease